MTEADFRTWLNDAARRWPSLGEWLKSNPSTLSVWLEDCFSLYELDECLTANLMIFQSGESFSWERIPGLIIRTVGAIRERRLAAARNAQTVRDSVGYRTHFDGSMRRALDDLVAFQNARREAGTPITPDERRAFVDEWFEKNDNEPDRERTYKCSHCCDTGWISARDRKGRTYDGTCGHCETGRDRKAKYEKNGRTIGSIGPTREEELFV